MLRKSAKRPVIAALSIITALALAAGAFAFFTSSGSGSGSASVGKPSQYSVTVDPASGGALFPGAGSDSIAYHVKNTGGGNQQVASISAALKNDGAGGGVWDTTSGAYVDGCQVSWFTVVNSPGTLPDNLAAGATHDGSATIALSDSNSDQNACQGLTPELDVNAS